MPKIRLTQVAVDKLKPPAAGRVEYWDTTLPGFGLRVAAPRAGGEARKTWQSMYRVNGKLVRETIGTLATIPKADAARDLARASMQAAGRGVHPVAERQAVEQAEQARERDTLAAVIDRYLDRYAIKRMRPDYYKETKRALDVDVRPALGTKPIGEVTRREIRELLERIVDRGSPSHANHVLSYLRAMMNWAVSNDLIGANPCEGLKAPAPKIERDRALTDDEIPAFWRGCDAVGWPFGPLFKLLLLTAQRRDELAEASWSEFDLEKALWTLPGERVKNGKAHLVHLPALAIEILAALPRVGDKGLVFTTTGDTPVSGWSVGRKRLAKAMRQTEGGEGDTCDWFTLHDLRRTAATGMAGLGVAPHVVDRVLNHVSGSIRGVAAIYNRHAYLDERRAALDKWSRHVASLVLPGGEKSRECARVYG
jgi:integrase